MPGEAWLEESTGGAPELAFRRHRGIAVSRSSDPRNRRGAYSGDQSQHAVASAQTFSNRVPPLQEAQLFPRTFCTFPREFPSFREMERAAWESAVVPDTVLSVTFAKKTVGVNFERWTLFQSCRSNQELDSR